MHHLPLLIRYGTAIWIACAIGLVLLGAALRLARGRLAATREAAAKRASLGVPLRRLEGLGEGPITIAGRLEAVGAPCERFEDGAPAAIAAAGSGGAETLVGRRSPEISVIVGGASIVLEGDVDLVVGSVEDRTGRTPRRLSAVIRRRIAGEGELWPSMDPVVLRSLRAGDEVIARGALRKSEASAGPGGYRTGAGGHRLAALPAGEGEPAGLRVAFAGLPRPGRSELRRAFAGALMGAAAFVAIFVGAARISASDGIPGSLEAALLAVTPFERESALDAYDRQMEGWMSTMELAASAGEALGELRVLRGQCDRAAEHYLAHGRWAQAAALGDRCKLPKVTARAAFERGEFERAARAWDASVEPTGPSLLLGLHAHLFAGHLDRAAEIARSAAELLHELPSPALACVADALDDLRGVAGARDALRARIDVPACAVLLADRLDGEARAAALHEMFGPPYRFGPPIAAILGLELGQPHHRASSPGGWSLLIFTNLPDTGIGAHRSAFDALAKKPIQDAAAREKRADLAGEIAAFECSAGDHAEAIRWAERAWAEHPTPINRALLDAAKLRSGARFEGDLDALAVSVFGVKGERLGKHDEAPSMESSLARGRVLPAYWYPAFARQSFVIPDDVRFAATEGRGAALARMFFRRGFAEEPALRIAALTTLDVEGRRALRRWIEWGPVRRCIGCSVRETFTDASTALAVAESINARDLAAEYRQATTALRGALVRRDIAVPLAILDELRLERMPALDIAAGAHHTCARLVDGSVSCWGANDAGQLGDGTKIDRLSPVAVRDLAGVVQIAAGGEDTCARLRDGSVSCWGSIAGASTPTPVAIAHATSIALGYGHACAIVEKGFVHCWGSLLFWPLDGPSTVKPVDVPGLTGAEELAIGERHACARMKGGTVRCWGSGQRGQLGRAQRLDVALPGDVPALGDVIGIAAGALHTCAVVKGGSVVCWGAGGRGRFTALGASDAMAPWPAEKLRWVTSLALGRDHGCALRTGSAECWGANDAGQLGDGTTFDRTDPVPNSFTGVVRATAGEAHSCLLGGDGGIWCAGKNERGELGVGRGGDHDTFVSVDR